MSLLAVLERAARSTAALDERQSLRTIRLAVRQLALDWWTSRRVPAIPRGATVPLEEAADVLLLCSWSPGHFSPEAHARESAFAHELAARGRPFATSEEPDRLFGKSVAWSLPNNFVEPRLWDYSRQVREFAAGLEAQGNRLFCSAAETAFWENKVHMHERLAAIGAPTPATLILDAESWEGTPFEIEPVLIKLEHSAGSAGIFHFPTARAAREFVAGYDFRPGESLIMQEVVAGATRDLRVTMVGDRAIGPATYWRQKSAAALAGDAWTTTATSNNSVVEHEGVPQSAAPFCASILGRLGVRTAGVDLIWRNDDLAGDPLILEFSPYYQPNPPKPRRYDAMTYKEFKSRWTLDEGYLDSQYKVFREIAAATLDQGLF